MRIREIFTDPIIGAVLRAVEEWGNFPNIGETVLPEYHFFCFDIYDFADKLCMESYFDRVKQFALKDKRKLLYVGCIYTIASGRRKLGCREFISISSAVNPNLIGLRHIICRGNIDGEGFTLLNISIRVGRFS